MDSDEEFAEFFATNEPPEHRRLKKLFLKRYSGKISSDELECLSQVLVNVEFLGCRYPKETMLRIEAMSTDILKEFGSSTKLRTLISADNAIQDRNSVKYRRTDASTSDVKSGIAFVTETKESSLAQLRPPLAKNASSTHRKYYDLLSSVIGFKYTYEDGVNIGNSLQKTIQEHKDQFSEKIINLVYECRYNGELLVKAHGSTAKKAKAEGVEKTYKLLKNYCPFFVKIASYCAENDSIITKEGSKVTTNTTKTGPETFQDNKIGADNIGFRMLKALGWNEDKQPKNGIVDPIGLTVKIGRAGLGAVCKPATLDMDHFKKLMISFRDSPTEFDLVFSSDFTKDERAKLHLLAQKLRLKTKSEGKEDERFLVVSKKVSITPLELASKVLAKDPFFSAIYTIEMPELVEFDELNI